MCILRDNIPADVWAEIEAIAAAPRYADAPVKVASQPAASVASQSTNNQTNTRRAPSWYVAGCLGNNELEGR